MRYRKFLMSGILTGAICLLTVLALTTEKAEAWGWYGFSGLCVTGSARGPEGTAIEFKIENAIVYTQCYNINGGNLGQPGVGNSGSLILTTTPIADPDKIKGWVYIPEGTCISLDKFDHHFLIDEETGEFILDETGEPILNPEHINEELGINFHTCWPLTNTQKIEQAGSAWIGEFVANWEWYDIKHDGTRRIIKRGRDICTWPGALDEDGFPEEGVFFECIEEVFK